MILAILAALLSYAASLTCPESRLPNSVYPCAQVPPTSLFVANGNNMNLTVSILIESLRGHLAQQQPRIFQIPSGSDYAPAVFWLSTIFLPNGVALNETYSNDPLGLLAEFRSDITGYILCDPLNVSVNLAMSLAGITPGAIVASSDLEFLMTSFNIPLIQDLRFENQTAFFLAHLNEWSHSIVFLQQPSKASFLNGYAVFAKAFSFYDSVEVGSMGPTATAVFATMNNTSALLGWGDSEDGLVGDASMSSIYVNAADWAENLEVYSNILTGPHEQRTTHTPQPPTINNVHTATFVFTDGDNIQWLLNGFASDPPWYGSPDRGVVPIGWTLSPALVDLAPPVMSFLYQNASFSSSAKDVFIAAASGVGYEYPSMFKDMNAFATKTGQYMNASDMNIVNVIDFPLAPGPAIDTLTALPTVDAVVYYAYQNYSQLGGNITWSNGKPIIGGRASMWAGDNTPAQIAEKLLSFSRDVSSPDAYSLIPVHAWSMNVSAVISCVEMLQQAGGVRVVAPDDFVKLLVANVPPPPQQQQDASRL